MKYLIMNHKSVLIWGIFLFTYNVIIAQSEKKTIVPIQQLWEENNMAERINDLPLKRFEDSGRYLDLQIKLGNDEISPEELDEYVELHQQFENERKYKEALELERRYSNAFDSITPEKRNYITDYMIKKGGDKEQAVIYMEALIKIKKLENLVESRKIQKELKLLTSKNIRLSPDNLTNHSLKIGFHFIAFFYNLTHDENSTKGMSAGQVARYHQLLESRDYFEKNINK